MHILLRAKKAALKKPISCFLKKTNVKVQIT